MSVTPETMGEHLLRNGLDFLHRAVANMGDAAGPKELKFAAVDLGVAVELLLKARLVREHWALVCKDAHKAKPAEFASGTLVTVGPDELLTRLAQIGGVSVSKERRAELDQLIKLRNRAIHFTFGDEDPVGLKVVLAKGLDFLLWLLENAVRDGGTEEESGLVEETIDELTTQLGLITALVTERMSTIADALASQSVVVLCPRCRMPAMCLGDGEPGRCAFCLWSPDGEEAAAEYAEAILGTTEYDAITEGGSWPVHHCLNCGERALVQGIEVRGGAEAELPRRHDPHTPIAPLSFGCFACGITYSELDVDFCARCGALTDGGPVCSVCYADWMGRP
jgi:hypothetical protein